MMSIEDWNYRNDPRTQGPAQLPRLTYYGCMTCGEPGESCDCPAAPADEDPVSGVHFYGTEIEVELPTKWDVCPVCRGEGTHVNPSIDCGGISASDFAEDPDFAEAYMSGVYDQPCNSCEGRRVIKVADEDAMDPEQRKLWHEQEREQARLEREERYEY